MRRKDHQKQLHFCFLSFILISLLFFSIDVVHVMLSTLIWIVTWPWTGMHKWVGDRDHFSLTFAFPISKGITNTSLTKDSISVLGNMCCTLNGAYIENSDPYILDKLNNCSDLTSDQVVAVESLLQSGATQHGYSDYMNTFLCLLKWW